MEELEVQGEIMDKVGSLSFTPPPMKKSDTKDSISSIDSDVSLSFDRRGSKGEEADFSDSGSSDCDRKSSSSNKKLKPNDHDSGADSLDDVVSQELDATDITETKSAATKTEDDEFLPPNDDLADKICAQVEFYFSDENIIKDAFLLKHVKRNKEGFVSLKLISSFKRVKHLSRDWRVVGAALARSKKLEVNDIGTKLRRLDPLPVYDQTTPSRTILAARLPVEKLSVETVAELFGSCGEIALIRILRPGHPAPAEVRQAIAKRPELVTNEECALVEFTDSASARTAMQLSIGEMRVYELQQSAEKKRKQQPSKKNAVARIAREDIYNSSSCASGSEAEDNRTRHRRPVHGYPIYPMAMYPGQPYQGPPSPESWLSRRLSACSMSGSDTGYVLRRLSSCSGSGSDTGSFGRRYSSCSTSSEAGYHHQMYPPGYYQQNRRFSCCSGSGSECGGGFNPSRRGSTDCGPFLRRLSACSRDSGFDPGVRRLSACSAASEASFCRSRSNSNGGGIGTTHLPDNVTRMPSGPDGTRGFGRPLRMNSMSQLMATTVGPTC